MASHVVRFDDWSGGEYGTIGGRQAPPGSFSALNMMVYRNGSLGPRAGLRDTTPAAVPAGVVWGFGSRSVPGQDGLLLINSDLYRFDLSIPGAALVPAGLLSAVPTYPVAMVESPNDAGTGTPAVFISSFRDRLYRYDGVVNIVATYGGKHLAVHGNRLVVANLAETVAGTVLVNRLRYSDAASPSTFNAADFIDIADRWQITGLQPNRDHLVISKLNQWLVLTGSLANLGGTVGVDATIRSVSRRSGPLRNESAVGEDDLVWYQGLFDRHPSYFTGSVPRRLGHLEYSPARPNDGADNPPGFAVVPLDQAGRTDAGVCFVSGIDDRAALLHNGVWSFHAFGRDVSGYSVTSDGLVHFCDGASPAKVWSWDYAADRPGDGLGNTMQGDGSAVPLSASVTLPEWWAAAGEVVQVRSVIVEFDKYSTGAAATNHFELVVDCLGPYQAAGTPAGTTQVFDEATSGGSSGTPHRATFGVDAQRGGGFRIRLEAIRGVALRAVTVIADIEAARTRA